MSNLYVKKAVTAAKPWTPDTDMTGVSVSVADREAGSPKQGDMIAWNPGDPRDAWLISAAYFADNYEPAD